MQSHCFQRKRKLPAAALRAQNQTKSSTVTSATFVKRPAPPPPTVQLRRPQDTTESTKENRISKLYKRIAVGDKVTNVRSILKRSKPTGSANDPDPSYGFASRYSDSKSYFRAHNVDNTIPTAIKREDLFDAELGDGNFRDILFPLRSSGGSQKSGGWTTPSQTLKPGQEDSQPQKKRVKFDDTLDAYEQKPFVFPSSSDGGEAATLKPTSLRDRIYDFFANLF